MPRALRRSRRQKKVLVDWMPALDIMLNQGYFTLTNLISLYQTSKLVQTLFTTFSLRLCVDYEVYNILHVPDNVTWCKIFKSFKTETFLNKTEGFADNLELITLIYGLVVYGHTELAFNIRKRFVPFTWRLELSRAILSNGSKAVYDECMQKFDHLYPNWFEEEKQDDFPPVPLFSSDLAEMTGLWEWFIDGRKLYYRDLAHFILKIGEYRSTVALDFLVSSLHKKVFEKASAKNTRTLRDALLDINTIGGFCYYRDFKERRLRKIYQSWDNPKAREFVAQVIAPIEKYLNVPDSFD